MLGAACYFSYPFYRGWQAERAVRQAKSFLEKRDIRSGVLSVRTALRHRPDHVGAHEIAALLLEASGSPEALLYRRTLMELQPGLLEPKLEFARSAISFDNPKAGRKVLDAIQGRDRATAGFRQLEAELFLANGRPEKAAVIYKELLVSNPGDKAVVAKLAMADFAAGSEQARSAARAVLESLVSDPEFGLIALQALARDALSRQQFSEAVQWSRRAREMPSAAFSDQLLYLQALFAAESPDYESLLPSIEKMAAGDARFAFQLGRWEVAALGYQKAAAWLESLPRSVRDVPLIGVLVADCYSGLNRWKDLESLVRWTSWRELEPLRLAFLARAQAGQSNKQKSERTWQLALAAAEKRPAQLIPLLAMARDDQRDVRDVLWLIAEKDPGETWARKELYEMYSREGNSGQMIRMMELVLKENPEDQVAKYNVAGLLMVIERDIERAERLARELHEADPQSLANAALYAYALKLKGEGDKGAKILDSRNDLDRLGNDANAYYALILFTCGRSDEALRFAAAVDRQELLPELRATLDQVF